MLSRRRFIEWVGALGGAPVLRAGQSIAAAAPAQAAVPPRGGARPPPPVSALRRSLVASSVEGGFAEIVAACAGGSVLTGWALHLHCSPFAIAVLSAIPFAGQIAHLPAAAVTARFGAKRVCIWSVLASRQIYLVLGALPFVAASAGEAFERAVLVAVAVTAAVFGVIGNNAWQAWMAALVPERVRGRYFGRRTAVCTGTSAVASLAAGLAIDHGTRHGGEARAAIVLGALAIVAALAGVGSAVFMTRQHEPVERRAVPRRFVFSLDAYVEPLRHPAARGLLLYLAAWNAANGLSSGFWAVHMLTNLRMGFARVAVQGTGLALARMLSAPLWGRALDRAGPRKVLVACSFGLALVPLAWTLARPDFLFPVVVDAVLGGVLVSGQGLAVFALPLAVAPARERPYFVAVFSMTGGAAFGVAAAVGGVLVARLSPAHVDDAWPFFAFHVLFVLAAVARLGAGVVGLRWLLPGFSAPRPEAREARSG